ALGDAPIPPGPDLRPEGSTRRRSGPSSPGAVGGKRPLGLSRPQIWSPGEKALALGNRLVAAVEARDSSQLVANRRGVDDSQTPAARLGQSSPVRVETPYG